MTSDPARTWLDSLPARGRWWFTLDDAMAGLGGTREAAYMALSRLRRKRLIASPYRGFYLVLPPEYREMGSWPAEHFLDPLMRWLGEPYYLALLTAAAMQGAAHQAPQRTQVVVARNRKPLALGPVRVDFVARHDMTETPTEARNTRMGTVRVATPAATALELVGYADRCGGLSHVATVLAELAEAIDPAALAAEGRRAPVAWAQRLGWLLERVEKPDLADVLRPDVEARATAPTPLRRSAPTRGAERDARWRLIVNADVEPDDL
jgi:predicted transcriptional regulator of viral defense system